MTEATEKRRDRAAARRGGYGGAIVINGALLYAVNVWPGWQVLPFLTDDLQQLLPLVNLSLIVGMFTNAVYLIVDLPRVKAVGDLVTFGIGMAILVSLWRVFPFAFPIGFDSNFVVRILIVLSMVGCGIGIIVQLMILVTGRAVPRR
ncbi:hypothetical protein JF66_01990 [Cryobacterium sp. MLB-32]|nr:hypothetical protein JF66_01990 [Cryobacterium sp. MLB-32]